MNIGKVVKTPKASPKVEYDEKKIKNSNIKKKGNLCHGESERFWVGCAWFTGLRDQWMV